jgi:hypothetical protein
MKLAMEITLNSGVKEKVTAHFADFIAFEGEKNRAITNLQSEVKLSDLAWLAWHSLKRRNQVKTTFMLNGLRQSSHWRSQPKIR